MASSSASRSGIRSGSWQWWCRMSHTTGRPMRRASDRTSRRAKARSSFSTTSRARAASDSCSKPSSKRSSAAAMPPAAPPTCSTTTASGPRPIPSSTSAWTSSSSTASRRMRSSSEFRTVYWPGWVDRRIPRRVASAPTSASRCAHSCGCARNRVSSGCDAYGASPVAMRYIADAVVVQVPQDGLEVVERDAEVGLGLPAPGVVRRQPTRSQDLDREAETHVASVSRLVSASPSGPPRPARRRSRRRATR